MSAWDLLSAPRRALLERLFPRRKRLAELRARWGKPGDRRAWHADAYFARTRSKASAAHVDDKTWDDLEFPRIFSRLDTTVTPLGSQWLYARMRRYVEEPRELAESYALAGMLRSNVALRERIQLALVPLQDDAHAEIVELLFGDPPQPVKYPGLLVLWSLFSMVTLVAVLLSAWPLAMLMATVAVNMLVIFRMSLKQRRDIEAMKGCLAMLPVADVLSAIGQDAETFEALRQLRQQRSLRKRIRASFRGLSLLQSELLKHAAIWLNIAFLLEQLAYARALKCLARERATLQSTYAWLGSIDAAVAMASALACYPDHCLPVVVDQPRIDIRDGYHPLLSRPVHNSLRLDARSALITGSNMAGKTTMIKMIATNLILGRTLGFCLAAQATLPRSGVMASIRSEHSVESGKSHYFAEIETLRLFIELAADRRCSVFVLDELFSGTNTVERIAIARAVLEQLSRDAQVLVTTHDVELQQVLSDRFDLYHFQENPDVDGFFDYTLTAGAATERNAIRLLERVGFPGDVVARAMGYVCGPPA